MNHRLFPLLVSFLLGLWLCGASASLPKPQGRVLLRVTGAVQNPNKGDDILLDQKALNTLPQQSIRGRLHWSQPAEAIYMGTPLAALLEAAGATGHGITLMGADGYTTRLGPEDITALSPIIVNTEGVPSIPRNKVQQSTENYTYQTSRGHNQDVVFGDLCLVFDAKDAPKTHGQDMRQLVKIVVHQ